MSVTAEPVGDDKAHHTLRLIAGLVVLPALTQRDFTDAETDVRDAVEYADAFARKFHDSAQQVFSE